MTINMGMKDAPTPSEGKSKGPSINGGKNSEGKGNGAKDTWKSKDDNKHERTLGSARGCNDGQIVGD